MKVEEFDVGRFLSFDFPSHYKHRKLLICELILDIFRCGSKTEEPRTSETALRHLYQLLPEIWAL